MTQENAKMPSQFNLYIDTVYGVRPKKGEAQHLGMLKKTSHSIVDSREEALEVIKAHHALSKPGYSRTLAARLFPFVLGRKYGESSGEQIKAWSMEEIDSLAKN